VFTHVLLLVAAGIAAAIAGGLIGVGESYLTSLISQGIISELRRQLFDRLLDQSVGFFTKSRSGEVMSRLTNDVDGVEDVVTDTVFGLFRNALVTVATLALMLRFSWPLTLVVLALIPLVALPARRAGRATYRARTATQTKLAEMTAYLQEILGISGILLVKAFVKGRAERSRFGRINDDLRRLQVRQEMIGRRFGMLMSTVQTAGPALIILAGGYLVLHGHTTVGTVFVFATVLGARLAGAASSLAGMHVNVTGSLALFRRLFDYIDLPPDITDAPDALALDGDVHGSLRLEHVTFTYPAALRPALADITLDIAPGQLVALVGPSGAGKTTLTTLVPRFLDPQQGRILLDGHDLRAVTLDSLGAQIGVVFQETFPFPRQPAREPALRPPRGHRLTAARRGQSSLPGGVRRRSSRRTGHHRRRTRTSTVRRGKTAGRDRPRHPKDPRIFILDEATSHLDTVSEQLIQAALGPLFAGRTSLVIAHRLSTVQAADVIVVLDRGRLVEHGSHADLLAQGGLYTTLYQRQFLSRAHSDRSSRKPTLIGA
jgi:ATP-binding cassette subfamily B protein